MAELAEWHKGATQQRLGRVWSELLVKQEGFWLPEELVDTIIALRDDVASGPSWFAQMEAEARGEQRWRAYTGEERAACEAFERHLDEHGCAAEGSHGFGYCDEAMRLFAAQPADRQIVMG